MNNKMDQSVSYSFRVFSGRNDCSFRESAMQAFKDMTVAAREMDAEGREPVWIRIFLSDIINQKSAVEGYVGSLRMECPVSVVEQPPLDGTKINIAVLFVEGAKARAVSPTTWTVDAGGEQFVYQTVRDYPADVQGGEAQTYRAFELHAELLGTMGLNVRDNTLRTWLFCRDIDRTYGGIVKGRNEYFATCGLTPETHFIASTGIGGYTARPETVVGVDFLSRLRSTTDDIRYLHALDHLNPTAQYGVAFERGTGFTAAGHRVQLISGTASIDKHGKCIHTGDPAAQTRRLVENIGALLSDDGAHLGDVRLAIVYLRDAADYHIIRSQMEKLLPGAACVYVRASVCRPAWLVETECIAIE